MNGIDWQIRIHNPMWWVQIVAAIIMPLIVGVGFQWEDMTSWAALGNAIWVALQNPVVFVAMLASVWTAITNPTTPGFADTRQKFNDETWK